jgi:hypothetical protein
MGILRPCQQPRLPKECGFVLPKSHCMIGSCLFTSCVGGLGVGGLSLGEGIMWLGVWQGVLLFV